MEEHAELVSKIHEVIKFGAIGFVLSCVLWGVSGWGITFFKQKDYWLGLAYTGIAHMLFSPFTIPFCIICLILNGVGQAKKRSKTPAENLESMSMFDATL